MENCLVPPGVRRLGAALLLVAAVLAAVPAGAADGAPRTYRAGTACAARLVGHTAPGRLGTTVRCTRLGRARYRWVTVVPATPATTATPTAAVPPQAAEPGPTTTSAAPPTTAAPAVPTTGAVQTLTGPAVAPAGWQAEMLASVNAERATAGAGALRWCPTLAVAAQGHTEDQVRMNTLTHTGSDGSDIVVRADRAGYLGWRTLGENVAFGYPDVASVMAGWMGSPGHRANLLNPAFTDVGFGRATGSYPGGTTDVQWWTQDFGAGGTC